MPLARRTDATGDGELAATESGRDDAQLQEDAGFDDEAAKLEAFTKEVRRKIPTPLAPKPARVKKTTQQEAGKPVLPKRSERLANHPLANVASSKRAEVVLMQRFDAVHASTPVNTDAKRAYKQLHTAELAESYFEAVRELLPALQQLPALQRATHALDI